MHQYLVGQGYQSYIKGAEENKPDPKEVDYSTWEHAMSRVMYCLATCVHDHMLGYIQEAEMAKEA